jgi:hypothetical protein
MAEARHEHSYVGTSTCCLVCCAKKGLGAECACQARDHGRARTRSDYRRRSGYPVAHQSMPAVLGTDPVEAGSRGWRCPSRFAASSTRPTRARNTDHETPDPSTCSRAHRGAPEDRRSRCPRADPIRRTGTRCRHPSRWTRGPARERWS